MGAFPGADPVPVNLDLAYRRDLAEGGVHLACVPGGGQVGLHRVTVQLTLELVRGALISALPR